MLVLSRKAEQSLLLGDSIVVTVLGIDGDRVKLGIEAPRSVAVLRQEVYQQLRASNTNAANLTARPSIHRIAAALRGQSAQEAWKGSREAVEQTDSAAAAFPGQTVAETRPTATQATNGLVGRVSTPQLQEEGIASA